MAGLVGLQVSFETCENETQSIILDTVKLQALAGGTSVDWRDGFRRMVSALHPELQLQP
jgi:hypothetical protein